MNHAKTSLSTEMFAGAISTVVRNGAPLWYELGFHAKPRCDHSIVVQVFFHTDAAQAVGKVPIDVNSMNIDLMSISGHKVYGPKGVGALYVRRRPRVRLEAQMSGGGQERGLRSGTVPTPLVVGFGEACAVAAQVHPC
jgi:cysteine sulfinate desulfinase/cysteine desulfurase-like protein